MIFAGIDAGSRAIKVALVNGDDNELIGSGVADQGVEQEALAARLFHGVLEEQNLSRSQVAHIVATGYGRSLIRFANRTVTEITCHAAGVRRLVPQAMTIVEIGGQDSKVMRLGPSGTVQDFHMNDRCAAGTGRFLEVVANRLNVGLGEVGARVKNSRAPAAISSMCVVFAETEIIGLLASGESVEDILAGVQTAVASRVSTMAGRRVEGPIVFTGGVALIPGMKDALERSLGQPVITAPDPQITGALGAAILAARPA